MIEETLYIRNMVCDRCITVVGETLRKLDIAFKSIQLGEILLPRPIDQRQKAHLSWQLGINGFEILNHPKTTIIQQVKEIITEIVDHNYKLINGDYNQFLTDRLHLDGKYISLLFSSVECLSIGKYVVLQRVERIKQLLYNNNLSLSQISNKLGYRNVRHLSNQFREITGMGPTQYKKVKRTSKQSLHRVD